MKNIELTNEEREVFNGFIINPPDTEEKAETLCRALDACKRRIGPLYKENPMGLEELDMILLGHVIETLAVAEATVITENHSGS